MVLATIVAHVEPPLDDLSISYPMTIDPPLFVGAIHDKLICDEVDAVAINPVGGDGAVIVPSADAWAKLIIIKTALRAKTFPNK